MAGKNDSTSAISTIVNDFLNIPVSDLRGVGPKRAELLAGKGVYTVLDLFYFIPRDYEDRSKTLPFDQLEDGKPAYVKGEIVWCGEEKLFRARKKLYKIIISEDMHRIELVWFNINKAYFSSISVPGQEISVYGTVKFNGNRIQMYHPDVSILDEKTEAPAFLPVYSAIDGLSNRILRSIIKSALDQYLDLLIDPLPNPLLKKEELPDLKKALKLLHFPDTEMDIDLLKDSATAFHKRILFDRFFNLMLKISHEKQQRKKVTVPPLEINEKTIGEIESFFPFTLTGDQLKSIKEIREDLTSGRPMNRLIMGDVGTGKTLIAAAAAYMVIRNNLQVTLMAPTQLLAEQHMEYFRKLPSEMGFKPVLLTGNLNRSAREEFYSDIKKGSCNIAIGTHALIQDKLKFKKLGLAIIDEQHRFGVRQRSTVIKKGKNTHVLSMSATPIPRTIAITLYWDRDLSIISQYPGKRTPVSTVLVERTKKRWIFDTLEKNISDGHQVYVICPLIDESENMELKNVVEMTEGLKKILSNRYRVEYIHGQQDPATKERTLKDFREGKIHVLVATTVIEVGIHVPKASLMIIEHPERLGLAQLHQLRGRIGRDGKGGTCILVSHENPSEKTEKRLKIMTECENGFEIAKKDMEFRGHGEITGIRQSGFSEFEINDILNHHDLFKRAGDMAKNIFSSDPDLRLPEHGRIKSILIKSPEITS